MKDMMLKRLEKDVKGVFSDSVELELDSKILKTNHSSLYSGERNSCFQDFKTVSSLQDAKTASKVSIII